MKIRHVIFEIREQTDTQTETGADCNTFHLSWGLIAAVQLFFLYFTKRHLTSASVLYIPQLSAYFGICRYFSYMTIPVLTLRIGHLQLFKRSVGFWILEVSAYLWFAFLYQ